MLLEDLKKNFDIRFKLYDILPEEQHDLIKMSDYFDENIIIITEKSIRY